MKFCENKYLLDLENEVEEEFWQISNLRNKEVKLSITLRDVE